MKLNALIDPGIFEELRKLTRSMTAGEKGFGKYTYAGQEKYLGYAPVPGTHWTLGVTGATAELNSRLGGLKMVGTLTPASPVSLASRSPLLKE